MDNFLRIESVEDFPEMLPLLQHGIPAQSGLHTLQHQQLEQLPVIVQRLAPFFIVVGDIQRVFVNPGTACDLQSLSSPLPLQAIIVHDSRHMLHQP
ncbi:hypothetical protein D3C74_441540 [compost metagenome]